ncbi:MAG TPA: CPBP family intramembrane metalloprotease [Chitinophagaceae bacterium]|nr:CPBP family intramembrane metalloprotease [Chitinophagaceae bacterium]
MRVLIGYLRVYLREIHKPWLVACMLLTGTLVYLNYSWGLEEKLVQLPWLPWPYFTGHVLLFIAAWMGAYVLYFLLQRKAMPASPGFLICLLLAPFLFAFKMAVDTSLFISGDACWNAYWNKILYWPLRVAMLTGMLYLLWRLVHRPAPMYGLYAKQFSVRPYLLMLLIMLPLIGAAATQADFQHTYPKFKEVTDTGASWWQLLLFELAYGSDFFSIELFFRGFLVIGFIKWMGKDSILPMACFYCAIHFGKPAGECISSFFGGILLGVVSYHTRSVYGGLIVHLGIAWLMELAGWAGNYYKW